LGGCLGASRAEAMMSPSPKAKELLLPNPKWIEFAWYGSSGKRFFVLFGRGYSYILSAVFVPILCGKGNLVMRVSSVGLQSPL
jgi:hypothetical protein